MASFRIRTAVLLVACIALTAAPSFAQRGDRRSGGDGGRRESVQRAQPRARGQSSGRAAQRQVEPRGRVESQGRGESQGRFEPRRRVAPPGRVEAQRRALPLGRVESQRRAESQSRFEPQRRVAPPRRVEAQRRALPRGRVAPRPGPGRGSLNNRTYNDPRYGYRPYVNRSRVLPYGYRPYGYRPGWSLNLYFGQPYSAYGYLAYGYGSPRAAYGYYAVVPGRAYGAVRIVDAPRDAQVFVDGYYAGVVDDYDGVFQHLNLEAGSHHIEIEVEGYSLIAFDVHVRPGQTITYRANIR